ncbi:unnamed protein product [Bursaphelenchus okinawaensis]|uniref:GTF3C1 extended winged-helix domain-containing protein n=1 Tax=Bursaphelenchus okinawaensis TaxID=465554 RepID=A0A811KY78_9BILA|nr:unnamed protein product [Bursaphelenchus okinawaensis]CAG9112947.1 unnamed protein product [Bursaphelenchus okinawaensis]
MEDTTEEDGKKIYYPYNGQNYTFMNRYRTQNDIITQAIVQSRSEGLDRIRIGEKVGINTKEKAGNRKVSHSIQLACKSYPDMIGQYQKMEGKFRMLRYFFKGESAAPTVMALLFKKAEEVIGKEFPFKVGESVKFPDTTLSTLRISDVTVKRMIMIMELLKAEEVVVTIKKLTDYIGAREATGGYKFAIDKKSVMKCLYALQKKRLLRILSVDNYYEDEMSPTLENELISKARSFQIVVSYDIKSVEDDKVKDAINKIVSEFHAEGKCFPSGHARFKKVDQPIVQADGVPVDVSNVDWHNLEVLQRAMLLKHSFEPPRKAKEIEGEVQYDPNVSYGYQAKMTRCSIMHEFIYRVVHDVEETSDVPCLYHRFPLGKPLPPNEFTQMDKLPLVDDTPNSPYRFVVGIPPYKDIQRGWFMLRDLMLGMPLSLYCMMISIKQRINGLDEHLLDPIKRHLPLGDLPSSLRRYLFTRKACVQAEHICLTLCALGHLRVGPSFDNGRSMIGCTALFFCGKKTVVYDTSSSERAYAAVTMPIERYNRYVYEFNTMQDVYRYWNHLKAIALSTPLNVRNTNKDPSEIPNGSKKWAAGCIDRSLFSVDIHDQIDFIEPYGTKEGCAGMDVNLFVHLIRHWEWRSPKHGEFVDWFIKRALSQATEYSSYVEDRVQKLEKNWNSVVSSLLPNDTVLYKQKRAEGPVLSQKALDAMSGQFRRHYSVRRSLNSNGDIKRRSVKAKVFPPAEEFPLIKNESNGSSLTEGKRKRTMDQVDIESKEKNMFIRSRFIPREYDMLVLIRGVSFFLNPIHRFWLNPTVMRDVMHEYVPESRCKTVNCLMAAGAREMVRPGRMAQLQYIVKTLASYSSMIEIRNKLSEMVFTDESAKNQYFLDAFKKAYEYIFKETNAIPSIETTDSEFDDFMKEQKLSVVISTSNVTSHVFPKRSKKPESVEDIHHCVAFNVVMSSLIGDFKDKERNEGKMTFESLVNSVPAKSLTEVLEIGRSDGLITRMRNTEQTSMMMRNQATFSIFYRHFFNHHYRNDLIDLVQHGLVDNFLEQKADENLACMLQLISQLYDDSASVTVSAPANIDDLIGHDQDQIDDKPVTKQLRKLENATLHLDKIRVGVNDYGKEWTSVPPLSSVVHIVAPKFVLDTEEKSLDKTLKTAVSYLKTKGVTLDKLKKLVDVVHKTEYLGVTTEQLMETTKLTKPVLLIVLNHLSKLNVLFPCGIDTRRWVSLDFIIPWMVETKTERFFIRPWTSPDGGVNWPILKWMAEGVLMTVLYKPGMTLEEIKGTYAYVLQPVLIAEIIEFFEYMNIVRVQDTQVKTVKKMSPFACEANTETSVFVLPTIYAIERFAAFFADVPSSTQFFKKYDANYHTKK